MDYKGTTNANPVNIQTKNIKPDNIFLKPKDDRTCGERWMTVCVGYRGAKATGKTQSRSVEINFGASIKESEEMQIE